MKKLIYSTVAIGILSLVFSGCKTKKGLYVISDNCQSEIFDFDTYFGKISRGNETIIMSDSGVIQIWSDAVTASNCNQASFHGGEFDTLKFYVACRSNPGFKGNLFSWCAVSQFKNQLCPKPWRVPTKEDFINLDIALGGTGEIQYGQATRINSYVKIWGVEFGGYAIGKGHSKRLNHGWLAGYWSQSEASPAHGHLLYINNDGIKLIQPQYERIKDHGFSIRCVRDN